MQILLHGGQLHAIDQGKNCRVKILRRNFTNITHDHLDYHKHLRTIATAKRFFDNLPSDTFALTNIDDRNGEYMVQNTKAQVHTYSCGNVADFKTRILEQSIEGMQLNINGTDVWCNFIGVYNAENLTAVLRNSNFLALRMMKL